MTRILVVDDDLALADVLAFTLRRAGFDILLAHDGLSALHIFERENPDLVILDWNLPRMGGLEVGQQLRAQSQVPIIMLTVRNADQDVVAALESCADDYVTKPFSPRQLEARVRALLRRAIGEQEERLTAGPLTIDPMRHEACWEGKTPISLTRLESRLLRSLINNVDHVMTASTLIARIWGPHGASRPMLKQLVYRLRQKIETDPSNPTLIKTIPNVGYLLSTPPHDT